MQNTPINAPPNSPFDRLPWKILRLVQNALLLLLILWGVALLLRGLLGLLRSPDLDAVLLQIFLLTSYLVFFLAVQFILFYFVLSRTRTAWRRPTALPDRPAVTTSTMLEHPAARHLIDLLQSMRAVSGAQAVPLGGLLLAGTGGSGTRQFAEALAATARVPLGYISAASLRTSRLGLGPLKVATAYRRARKLAREYGACVLLLDEFDALAGPASRTDQSGVVQEILLQIDPPLGPNNWLMRLLRGLPFGAANSYAERVLTIGAVHDLAALDPALLHDSRFARQLVLPAPDAAARRVLVQRHLRQISHEPLQIEALVAATAGATPDRITRLLDEALLYARADGRSSIRQSDLERALAGFAPLPPTPDDSAAPPDDDSDPPLTPTEQRRLACYRAGQVYAWSHLLPHTPSPEVLVTLHPTAEPDLLTDTLDTLLNPESLQQGIFSRRELLSGIQIALAGRAATDELLHEQTTAAAPDLVRATVLAGMLVGSFGMGQSLLASPPDTSDLLHPDLREQVQELLQTNYRDIYALLVAHRDTVQTLAEALLLRGQLSVYEVDTLLHGLEPLTDPPPAAPAPLVAHRYTPPTATPPEPAAMPQRATPTESLPATLVPDAPLPVDNISPVAAHADAVAEPTPDHPLPSATAEPPPDTPATPNAASQQAYRKPEWGSLYEQWGPPPDDQPGAPRS